MFHLLIISVIFTLICGEVTGIGYYQVIGPKTVRPLSDHHISVSIDKSNGPTLVVARIEGISYNGTNFIVQDLKQILPYSSEILKLKIPFIPPGSYRLQVEGKGGIDFISYYPLNYLSKSYTVLIETDKSVYNPGGLISFRVIVLNSDLKPIGQLPDYLIYITDNDGNKIKYWKNLGKNRGTYTDTFKLSKNPVLGTWNITVKINEQEYYKNIKIAKYIIPTFKIEIETKKHVTFNEGKIIAKLKTNYHHGEKLEGEATINISPKINSEVIQPIYQNPYRKTLQINGESIVEFDIEKDLKLNNEYERILMVDVLVEEKLNGRRENTSVKIHLHKYPYKIDLIKTSNFFKPGLKYIAYAKLTKNDELSSPSSVENEEVIIRHSFDDKNEIKKKYKIGKNGITMIEFLTPKEVTNYTALRIEANYIDLKEKMSPILPSVSYSNQFIQITMETDKPLVNLDIEFLITSTENLKYINYVIFGRGDVILTKTLQVNNKKELRFNVKALHSMVPKAHIIVSYIREENGEMIGDTLNFEVEGLLQNFLEVRSSTTNSEPGFDIDIQMKSQPYSYIGLMAVDVKNLLLGNDFYISKNLITPDLFNYENAEISEYYKTSITPSKIDLLRLPWKPGGSNIFSGIENSGGDVLTNGHILRKIPTFDDIYLRPVVLDGSTVKPDRGIGVKIHSVTRPPLAGPYAFSRIPTPVWNIPKVYLNENIEDTWIFTNFTTRYDGIVSTHKKLPNTLTNWMMTGFSLDPVYGLGIMQPKLYKTSKSFYIKLDLPFSIIRGETINLPTHIYNNMDQSIDVEVTLHNQNQNFDFTTISNEISVPKRNEYFQKKKVRIMEKSNGTVYFLITPNKLGLEEIKVTASNPYNQDVVTEFLRVKAEGETEFYTKTELLDLRGIDRIKKQINFTIPKNVIKDSEKIEFSCNGNLFGKILNNFNDLIIKKPTRCGEQNLLNMMKNIIVLQYIKFKKENSQEMLYEKSMENLMESYENQLNFKRKDGTFSVFGRRDKMSSVWLTAYTLMALRKASEFIYIDEEIIEKGYEWLEKIQQRNGSFYEIGNEIHAEMQNKNGKSLPLTSFVLTSFIENQKHTTKYKNLINKGLDYIARYIDDNEEIYSITLCSYVLQISKHPSKQSAFNLLDNRSNNTKTMKWWSKPIKNIKNPWNNSTNSLNIEMTSYSLITYIEMNYIDESISILNWLLKQQNDNGGFESTQDTTIAIEALFKFLSKFNVKTNIDIDFIYDKKNSGQIKILNENELIEHKFELDKSTREINLTAKGNGIGYCKINYNYNKDVTGPFPSFILDPQIDKISNRDHLQLSICIRYIEEKELSNMAVMEVNLPSGYTVDIHSLPSLETTQNVQKVEIKNELTKVILYFNNISNVIEYCPTVSSFRTFKIANQKPVAVVLYDYYDTSRQARVFYKPPSTTICDICTDVDCESACVIQPKPQIREGESKSDKNNKGINLTLNITMILLPLLILLI